MNNHRKHAEMYFGFKLLPAVFVARPNRFLTLVRLNDSTVESHLPDPGRLRELLIPGVKLLVKREDGPNRKTKYSTQAVYRASTLVSLNTLLPNRFVEFLLRGGHLPQFSDWQVKKREAVCGDSRFDFLLQNPAGHRLWLEVKSVTYVEEGIARFPDAVSARGARHLHHLARLARSGERCAVLFVVQRRDACLFKPFWERDPALGEALLEARGQGVQIHVISTEITPQQIIYRGELPAELERG